MVYPILRRLMPSSAVLPEPRRIVLIRPCCIGDVVMATAALSALRETFPKAHISWALGPWSARAIADHPALDSVLDIGDTPLRSPATIWRFLRLLREGQFDLAISLAALALDEPGDCTVGHSLPGGTG